MKYERYFALPLLTVEEEITGEADFEEIIDVFPIYQKCIKYIFRLLLLMQLKTKHNKLIKINNRKKMFSLYFIFLKCRCSTYHNCSIILQYIFYYLYSFY